ncbi:MAG: carbohydrate binding family 9 domain-containing protein [Phycisphaerales bacterium]|nr:carbohydrate binding family 9 domain-containing protein [Phycisphaerales bacterium]
MPPHSGPAIHALIAAIASGIAAQPLLGQLDESERESIETATTEQTTIFTIDEAPEIDGVFEELWQDGTRLPDNFLQVDPVEGGPPSEVTEVYLMRDARNFYVGFRCLDSDPSGIRANQMQRDGDFDSDDAVTVVIDPFRDRRTGYIFKMTAGGARKDGRITGGSKVDYNWDGIWYGRVNIDDQGWTCEMAIPFQTILASVTSEDWGFNFERFIRRKNENIRWSSARRDVRISSVSNAEMIDGFGNLDIGQGLDVRPFIKGSATTTDSAGTDMSGTGGLDVFWKLPPSLTLALTINNDFAETEVDQRQINFGRFPLFFPEKRDFFLEDAGIFDFGGIGRSPLPFYSRRIGIAPDGSEEGVLAGARLTGKVDDLNIGLMDVQMKADGNWKNYGVARLLGNVLDESTAGVILTGGDPTVGQNNYVGGFDFNYRNTSFDGDQILLANAYVLMSETSNEGGEGWAGGWRVRRPGDVISWSFGMSRISEDYDAALGFNPRVGIYEYFGNWRHRWRPDVEWIRSIDTELRGYMVTDLDSTMESMDLSWEMIQLATERGDVFSIEYERRGESPDSAFSTAGGQLDIDAGTYHWNAIEGDLRTTDAVDYNLNASAGWSGYYGGNRIELGIGGEWNVSPQLLLGAQYQWNDIEVQGQKAITRQLSLIADIYFTPDVSLTNFIQYDNISDTVGINSRLRWIFEPGNDLFIVINHNVESEDLDLTLIQTQVIAKIGWTLRF